MWPNWSLIVGLVLTVIGRAMSNDQPSSFRRFEYKHSFKGPHLVDRKGRVPFWDSFGNSLPSADQVRLTPSIRSMKGSIWNTIAFEAANWEVEAWLRVTGRGTVGGDGMAIWFRDQAGTEGPVFGTSDLWNGMGLILDSFDNDGSMDNPMISLIVNDGTKAYDHEHDGRSNVIGQCKRDFRNRPHSFRLRITYWNNELKVEYDHGSSPEPFYELCLQANGVHLSKKGYFGLSAATGGLADDHDAVKFLVSSLSSTSFAPAEMPTIESKDADKAEEMYQQYSQDLEQKKEEYAKEHPGAKVPEYQYESPFDRSVNQILSGMQDIRAVIMNLQATISSGAFQGQQGVAGTGQASGGSADAMISQALARMTQEVQQTLRRNQEDTSSILRLHGETLRRASAPGGPGGPGGAGGIPSHAASELTAMRNEMRQQQATIQEIVSQLAVIAQQTGTNAKSQSQSDSSDCLSYSTVLIVALVEAVVAVIIFWRQKQKAAAAEKKFF